MVSTPTVQVRTEEASRMRVKHLPGSFISEADSARPRSNIGWMNENRRAHVVSYIPPLLDTYFIKNIQ